MPLPLVADPSALLLFLLEVSLKGSLVLAAAGLATSLLRRAPSSLRHTIWTTAIVAVAVLPVVMLVAPKMDVGVLPASTVSEIEAVDNEAGSMPPARDFSDRVRERTEAAMSVSLDPNSQRTIPAPAPPTAPSISTPATPQIIVEPPQQSVAKSPGLSTYSRWTLGVVGLWAVGVVAVALRFLVGIVALRRIRKRSEPVADVRFRLAGIKVARSMGIKRRVQFMWGDANGMPLTWGWIRPTVLLPDEAREWPAEKTLAVLKHELAHIKRNDCLVQTLVYVVCAFYWFNPLVWMAAANSRREREMACDDYVINSGTTGTDYADHLLAIARSLRSADATGVSTIAMARPSELEGRLMAILSKDRQRSETTPVGVLATVGFLAAISLPLAALRPVPAEEVEDLNPRHEVVAEDRVVGTESEELPESELAVVMVNRDEPRERSREVIRAEAKIDATVTASVLIDTEAYIAQVNELVEKATRTLQNIERLEPSATEWEAEFGGDYVVSADTVSLSQLRRLSLAGVDVEFIEELAAVGLDQLTVDQLISLTHADVDADYVIGMQSVGYRNLSPEELARLGYANVEPNDVAIWANIGYRDLTSQDLIRLAHANVDAGFVNAMAQAGYRDLGPDELLRMSHADVDPEFVAQMRRAGYSSLSADELITLAHANIDADYVNEIRSAGLTELSARDLIRMSHANVDLDFIEELRRLGFDTDDVDEVVRLRYVDLDPEYVERMRRKLD